MEEEIELVSFATVFVTLPSTVEIIRIKRKKTAYIFI